MIVSEKRLRQQKHQRAHNQSHRKASFLVFVTPIFEDYLLNCGQITFFSENKLKMKKLILFGIIALLSALTVFASSVSLADTLEMGSGSYGPQNISTPNTTVVVCDVNHETGFVTISSSLPGPAVVIITSQTTQETTQVFFHGEVALFVPPHEEYTIVIILANGATFSGSFNVY